MKTFDVEYEIPPLRAIYNCEADAEDEQGVRNLIAKQEPRWVIRKIKEIR